MQLDFFIIGFIFKMQSVGIGWFVVDSVVVYFVLCCCVWQFLWWYGVLVVGMFYDDWQIWIVVFEIYQYFLVDMWDLDYFEVFVCLWVVDVYLVGVVFIYFVVVILVKLYFYLFVLICLDFLVCWVGDDGVLWFFGVRFVYCLLWVEYFVGGVQFKMGGKGKVLVLFVVLCVVLYKQ